MTYKILSTRQVETILYTLVEYTFNNQIITVEVAHFNPQLTLDIETNIINRAQSELQKLEMIESINQLLPIIEVNEIKDINI